MVIHTYTLCPRLSGPFKFNMPKNTKKQQKRSKNPKPGKSQKKRKQKQGRTKSTSSSINFSECGAKYIMCLKNPFDMFCVGACVPRTPARPSQKISYRKRFNVSTGVEGMGFVLLCPTVSNDLPAAYATNSSYTQPTAIKISTDGVGAPGIYNDGLPYSQSLFNVGPQSVVPQIQGRIISVGLRWRYTGTVLNQGGSLYSFVDPNHGNCNNSTLDIITGKAECVSHPVSKGWQNLVLSAVEEAELAYGSPNELRGINDDKALLGAVYPFSNYNTLSNIAQGYMGGCPALIVFYSSVPITFECEMITHVEYIGKSVQSTLSPSHGDDEALNIGMEAAGSTLREQVSSGMDWASAFTRTLSKTYMDHRQTLRDVAGLGASLLAPSVGRRMRLLH